MSTKCWAEQPQQKQKSSGVYPLLLGVLDAIEADQIAE
jgi:hypothetical protein